MKYFDQDDDKVYHNPQYDLDQTTYSYEEEFEDYQDFPEDSYHDMFYDEEEEFNAMPVVGPKRKKKRKGFLFWLIFLISFCVFCYSSYQLFLIFRNHYEEKQEKDWITEVAQIPEDITKPFQVNWEELRKINDRVLAWVVVPDTDISYPVVQGDDNYYYLWHTYAKKYNPAGAIFIDYQNDPNFKDNNTFMYGHNTKHKTIFGELEKFKDKEFFDNHPYVYLFTPEVNYRAEIISFHSTKDRSDFYRFGITDPTQWKSYLDMISNPQSVVGHVRSSVVLDENTKLLSLSTCSYEINGQPSDQRYLLHTKLVPWDGEYTEEAPEGPMNLQ